MILKLMMHKYLEQTKTNSIKIYYLFLNLTAYIKNECLNIIMFQILLF